jgi:hypothetical protein
MILILIHVGCLNGFSSKNDKDVGFDVHHGG